MLDKMKRLNGAWSMQAEQISAMLEFDLMVWQKFALISIPCDALLFFVVFLECFLAGTVLLRAGTLY